MRALQLYPGTLAIDLGTLLTPGTVALKYHS